MVFITIGNEPIDLPAPASNCVRTFYQDATEKSGLAMDAVALTAFTKK
jgi:hypothetical protein